MHRQWCRLSPRQRVFPVCAHQYRCGSCARGGVRGLRACVRSIRPPLRPCCQCCPPASAADPLSPDRQWQQTRSFAVDTACCGQERPDRDRPTPAGFPRTRSSVTAAGQTTLVSSDRPGLQHRHNVVGGHVCPWARPSNPTLDQTGSQGSRAASGNDDKQTGSWSCMSSGFNCSFQTATMLESRRKSLSYTICATKPWRNLKGSIVQSSRSPIESPNIEKHLPSCVGQPGCLWPSARQYTHKFLFCRIGLCCNSCKITGGSR